jgi:hypothetical protein
MQIPYQGFSDLIAQHVTDPRGKYRPSVSLDPRHFLSWWKELLDSSGNLPKAYAGESLIGAA